MKAYTHLIGWSKLNLWYYGVRYKKGCRVEDLFTIYFTSSLYVKSVFKKHGKPDVIQIRKTFDSVRKSLLWEQTVQRRLKVNKDPKWLNKNISGAIYYDEEVRQKMREMKMNRSWMFKDKEIILVLNELVKEYEKLGYKVGRGHVNGGSKNGMWGKKHSEETKRKIGLKNSRCTLTEAGRKKKAEFMKKNNPMDDPSKRKKISDRALKYGTTNKKVTDGQKIYNSLREANKNYPDIKYSTLAYWCSNEKNGWKSL